MKLIHAQEAFLEELAARGRSPHTIRGYVRVFGLLNAAAQASGALDLADWDAQALRKWRATWDVASSTHRLHIVCLKAFFKFAADEGWLPKSPAERLRPPPLDAAQTMPLSVEEMRALILAATSRSTRALLLLMRYSGLSIQDAATLARARLEGSLLTLRRAKTGELVQVDLPAPVCGALNGLPRKGEHYFWNGTSQPRTAAGLWSKRLREVGLAAGVEGFHTHRLRDTFAAELLLKGVSMEDVSALLGHSSIQMTERYYAPWSAARRDRLVRVLREAHQDDTILDELREA